MSALLKYIEKNRRDAIMWQSARWLIPSLSNPHEKANATKKTAALLALVEDVFAREEYIKSFTKIYSISKTSFTEAINEKREEKFNDFEEGESERETEPIWPEWLPDDIKDQVYKDGFTEREDGWDRTGYYFMDFGNKRPCLVLATNFTMKPLYHVYSQNSGENRRMLEVNNGHEKAIVEFLSKNALSFEYFKGVLFSEGTFLPQISFTNAHLLRIWNKIDPQFNKCWELTQLGYQAEGFFAFSNIIYLPPVDEGKNGILCQYDEYGVAKVADRHFLSPSNSKANDKVRSSDNIYEDDMYLLYKPSAINFEQWAALMAKAYNKNAWFVLPWVFATLFRDLILKTNQIPHLYLYGGVGSGKSAEGDSIQHLFFSGKSSQGVLYKAYNLNQGTEFAFWNRMERFFNCPNILNEFDEDEIDENRFRAIKSAYDGEGRTKGVKEKNKTTTQKVNCTLVLLGQYLGKKDDNAVLMRSLPLSCKRDDNRPDEQVEAFRQLAEYQEQGLSGIICEMINLRPFFKLHYADKFANTRKRLQNDMKSENVMVPERILKNVACMVAISELVSEKIKLPYSNEAFYSYCKDFTRNMTNLISSTSALSEFWRMVDYLADTGLLKDGIDFEIEETDTVTVDTEEKKAHKMPLGSTKKVLYIKMVTTHTEYTKQVKNISSKPGLNQATLITYLKEQSYYIGHKSSHRFGNKVTSAYVFHYDAIGINIQSTPQEKEGKQIEITIIGEVTSEVTELPGNTGYKFGVTVYKKKDEGKETEQTVTVYYQCFIYSPDARARIIKNYQIELTGKLSVVHNPKSTLNRVDVTDFKTAPSYRKLDEVQPEQTNMFQDGYGKPSM